MLVFHSVSSRFADRSLRSAHPDSTCTGAELKVHDPFIDAVCRWTIIIPKVAGEGFFFGDSRGHGGEGAAAALAARGESPVLKGHDFSRAVSGSK
jgi:hypothetical protein